MSKLRLVVLISGGGSNLQAIIDAVESGSLNAEIGLVLSNKPEAGGLERAKKHGIATAVLDHKSFASRDAFDRELADQIQAASPDLVILAGFMRILTPDFVAGFEGRLLNIHPSLLPKYPGLNTHQRAIDAGDEVHGVTVHFVTAELDGGPPILQSGVIIEQSDTAETLAAKVLKQEHVIYPLVIHWFGEGRLHLAKGEAFFDNEALPSTGMSYNQSEMLLD